jgi:glycosyltransferase involved in cell wall biosynthesis
VITVSQFSKDELIRALGIAEDHISYTWLSAEHILRVNGDDSILDRNHLEPGKYVLAVGSQNPNKNLARLARAFDHLADLNVPLAIAGGSNSTVFGKTEGTSQAVRTLGFVTDAELRSLYEHAACFVFPSLYEGFGIPPLEALTLGTPVVVSRAASLPEVFGRAATYCDPYSPQDIAEQVRQVLRNEVQSREARKMFAGRFTWEACALKTWGLLLEHL